MYDRVGRITDAARVERKAGEAPGQQRPAPKGLARYIPAAARKWIVEGLTGSVFGDYGVSSSVEDDRGWNAAGQQKPLDLALPLGRIALNLDHNSHYTPDFTPKQSLTITKIDNSD